MKSQCFPDHWLLLMVLAAALYFLFKVSSIQAARSAATQAAARTRPAKMLISQTVPIGIAPRSAGGEG